jgi:hypothetical protein
MDGKNARALAFDANQACRQRMRSTGRPLAKAIVIIGIVGLVLSCTAYALKAEVGRMVVSATGTLMPRSLPTNGNAPVTLTTVTRIRTKDKTPPPSLKTMVFQFDRNGKLDNTGLPVCTRAMLIETTPQVARKRCAGALVGEGTGKAEVNLPGLPPTVISSPLSFFNAPPVGGKPSLIVHAYETLPSPKTVLVPIVIERVRHGRYGFQAKVEIPEIAEGYGSPTLATAKIGRTFERGGKTVGYVSAHCQGGRLQVYGALTFDSGDFFPGTLTSPCHSAS